MWVLLAISLFASNDGVNTLPIRQYVLSEDCQSAKDNLSKGDPGSKMPGALVHFICLKKPKVGQ